MDLGFRIQENSLYGVPAITVHDPDVATDHALIIDTAITYGAIYRNDQGSYAVVKLPQEQIKLYDFSNGKFEAIKLTD